MRLQVTAYSATTGQRLQVLTEARSISFTNDGTLTFDLPKNAVGIEYFDGDIAVAVEIEALAGKTFGPLTYTPQGEVTTRFIYQASDESRSDVAGVWKYTLPALADAYFKNMPILTELGHTTTYGPTATPYTILANRILEAKNRGLDLGITVVDGGGWTTPNVATGLVFDNHATLDALYTALRDGKHAELIWVGTTLYVLPPGTMAIDRTAAVRFQVEDFSNIPVKVDRSGMADTILALGDNGTSAIYPATAPGKVLPVQFAGVSDPAILADVAQREWTERQTPAREITVSLALATDPALLPYRDYREYSLTTFPTKAGGTEVIGVAQITLTQDLGADFSGNLILDTKIKSTMLRLVELGKLGVGGVTAVSGNGTVLPDVARSISGTVPINAAGVPGVASGLITWTLKAGWVELVFNVNSSTGWVSGVDYTIVAAAVIPYLPQAAAGTLRGATYLAGGFTGIYGLAADGTVRIFHTTGAVRTSVGFTIVYPI